MNGQGPTTHTNKELVLTPYSLSLCLKTHFFSLFYPLGGLGYNYVHPKAMLLHAFFLQKLY
jgi:hypothetical protein